MDSRLIDIAENGLYLTIEITAEQDVRLLHFGAAPLEAGSIEDKHKASFRLLELQLSGKTGRNITGGHTVRLIRDCAWCMTGIRTR